MLKLKNACLLAFDRSLRMFVLEDTLQGLIIFNRIKKPNINSSKVRKVDKHIRRDRIRKFIGKYADKENCKETQDYITYWLDLLEAIFGIESNCRERVQYQKDVIVNRHTKTIDIYIKETQVIIEQKSYGLSLDQKHKQSDDAMLTPYEQAKRYNDNLPKNEKASWIVTSNFSEIWIYDMNKIVPDKEENIVKLKLADLESEYYQLEFLLNDKVKEVTKEVELSLQAGELIGKIYDLLYKRYHNKDSQQAHRSLNVLCVRLVFCLYAEKADLFKPNLFAKYIKEREPKDIRQALISLFKVLDTKRGEDRQAIYVDEELDAFPYVNGGLFEEEIEIPLITKEIKEAILEASRFKWAEISPTIFGAVFESTLNPETRRSGGMHYTSIENIHKVIDPLFLNDLTKELDKILIDGHPSSLYAYQNRLAKLRFLDPACGSGNFLTETYICLRKLENRVLSARMKYIEFNFEDAQWLKVSIDQFYGIEINDFAVTVAKTALWIAESQMIKSAEDILNSPIDFLPLKTNANIVEGNALRIDWESVVPKEKLSYIYGNPPFVGSKKQSKEQKIDMRNVLSGWHNAGNLDYVACWFKKASDYMKKTKIKTALVATNSITQGEEVASLWKPLFNEGMEIIFAHQTFRWDSEALIKAQVHCVIIGFAEKSKSKEKKEKRIYKNNTFIVSDNINGYLLNEKNVFLERRAQGPLCDVPPIIMGPMALSNNFLVLEKDEKEAIIAKEPEATKWIRRFSMGDEFISGEERYCLWLQEISPEELRTLPLVYDRVKKCREWRYAQVKTGDAYKYRDIPHLFRPNAKFFADIPYLAIPQTSSENRKYIPMGFVDDGMIPGQKLYIILRASKYIFGVLTSIVHMAWMRKFTGRMKSDYSYSIYIVYNNFPWPTPTKEQKERIEQTAEAILSVRAKYPDCSLASLYDPIAMPSDLRKAHEMNDKAVINAYGIDVKTLDDENFEAECVTMLMQMYQKLTNTQKKE